MKNELLKEIYQNSSQANTNGKGKAKVSKSKKTKNNNDLTKEMPVEELLKALNN